MEAQAGEHKVVRTMEVQADGNKVVRTIDQILKDVGEFGMFQKTLDGVIALLYLVMSYQVLFMYFITITPPWRCVEGSVVCVMNDTHKGDDTHRCNMSRNEWYYTEAEHYSLVTQFDIHCDRRWLLEIISSIQFVGWAIGAISLGWIGDRFGRKILLFPSVISIIVVGFVSPFLPNIYLVIVCRFIIGFFIPGVIVQASILISELVSNKHRPLAALIPFFSLPIGYGILALKAYLLQNWKMLSIACTAPYIFTLVFYPFTPESIRWLQTHGRTEDAMFVFHKIARWNKKVLPSTVAMFSPKRINSYTTIKGENVRAAIVILPTIIQGFLWFNCAMCFFGLQLAANELEGSIYRDFTLLGMIQFPAIIVAIIGCNKFGRKKVILVALLFAGASCLGVSFVPARKSFNIARIILGVIGKFLCSIAFQGVYIWSNEIFPTHARSKGMGFVQVCARIGAAVSPWVVKDLKRFGRPIPFIVMGVPAIIASALGLWLPETKTSAKNTRKEVNSQSVPEVTGENIELEESTQGNKQS